MLIDTETCTLQGPVYDLGYVIASRKGSILARRNWLVEEIFTDSNRMMGAFYAKKFFSHYANMLQTGLIKLTPWNTIIESMREDIASLGVSTVAAYNLPFDKNVIRNTGLKLGHLAPVFQHPVKQLCIWRFAKQAKCQTKTFKQFTREHGFLNARGYPSTSAEIVYRYLTGDWNFQEQHTALHDAEIELEILTRLFTAKQRIPYIR
jgi:hypothetical protein